MVLLKKCSFFLVIIFWCMTGLLLSADPSTSDNKSSQQTKTSEREKQSTSGKTEEDQTGISILQRKLHRLRQKHDRDDNGVLRKSEQQEYYKKANKIVKTHRKRNNWSSAPSRARQKKRLRFKRKIRQLKKKRNKSDDAEEQRDAQNKNWRERLRKHIIEQRRKRRNQRERTEADREQRSDQTKRDEESDEH